MALAKNFEKVFAELSATVRLDKNDLDRQLCEHAELFRSVCELLSICEDDLVLTEAEADREIRDAAAEAEEKITEVEIKRRLAFNDEVGKLKFAISRLKGLKEAYIERRHAFNKLVDLYGAQYWGEPRGSKRVEERDANREKIREANRTNRR